MPIMFKVHFVASGDLGSENHIGGAAVAAQHQSGHGATEAEQGEIVFSRGLLQFVAKRRRQNGGDDFAR
jgi:hypothetical protein